MSFDPLISDVFYLESNTPAVFFMSINCHFPFITIETYKTESSCLVTFSYPQIVECSKAIVGLGDTDKETLITLLWLICDIVWVIV